MLFWDSVLICTRRFWPPWLVLSGLQLTILLPYCHMLGAVILFYRGYNNSTSQSKHLPQIRQMLKFNTQGSASLDIWLQNPPSWPYFATVQDKGSLSLTSTLFENLSPPSVTSLCDKVLSTMLLNGPFYIWSRTLTGVLRLLISQEDCVGRRSRHSMIFCRAS